MKDTYAIKLLNLSSGLAYLMLNSKIVIWCVAALHGSSVGEAFAASMNFKRKILSSFFKQMIDLFFFLWSKTASLLFSLRTVFLLKCATSLAASAAVVVFTMLGGPSDGLDFSQL